MRHIIDGLCVSATEHSSLSFHSLRDLQLVYSNDGRLAHLLFVLLSVLIGALSALGSGYTLLSLQPALHPRFVFL